MSLKEAEIKLDTKLVGDIEGHFFIPSYQRGYRWGEKEVTRLLNDIYKNGGNNYCLQPVVLRNNGDSYELIDGQQRLTTLFILLRYIQKEFKPRIKVKYDLAYETRSDSAAFLKDIDESKAESNIDYFHIVQAYRTIDAWFKRQKDEVVAADDMYGYLAKNVKVIWYEVGKSEDGKRSAPTGHRRKKRSADAVLLKSRARGRGGPRAAQVELAGEDRHPAVPGRSPGGRGLRLLLVEKRLPAFLVRVTEGHMRFAEIKRGKSE